MPRAFFKLDPGSPQPDFKTAFTFIKENKKPGDAIISSYTQLHRIFLGEDGYWLSLSFDSISGDLERRTVNGRDYYVDAPVIGSASELRDFIKDHHGFVLMDHVMYSFLPDDVAVLEESQAKSTLFESVDKDPFTYLKVYRF
jgi:hypothetical protein